MLKILGSCLFLFLVSSTAMAGSKTSLYQGTWHGTPCTVTINWANYGGLGNVSGDIFISGDKSYLFKGSSPVPGRIELFVPGDPIYKFDRSKAGGKVSWTLVPGGEVSFSRNDGGSGLPGGGMPGGGSGLPGGVAKPDPKITTSNGTWGGAPMKITIHWDNYAGQGPVNGNIAYNGLSYSFAGSNPRRKYMEITIDGVNGVYLLNKAGAGESAVWSGSLNGTLMSFSRTGAIAPGGGGGGVPGNQPGAATWLIACEADRDKATAEQNATVWRQRGFGGTRVVHKSEYKSLNGDQDWWIACPGSGSKAAMRQLLQRVLVHYPSAYGIKADQSARRETFE